MRADGHKYYVYRIRHGRGDGVDALGRLTPAAHPPPGIVARKQATSGATLLINPTALPDGARGAAIGRKVPAMTSRRGAYPLS